MSTKADLIACVDREIRLRLRVFPRFVQEGRMTAKKADEEISLMREVRAVLEALPDDEPQGELFDGNEVHRAV